VAFCRIQLVGKNYGERWTAIVYPFGYFHHGHEGRLRIRGFRDARVQGIGLAECVKTQNKNKTDGKKFAFHGGLLMVGFLFLGMDFFRFLILFLYIESGSLGKDKQGGVFRAGGSKKNEKDRRGE
jgi:hypothetical protein